MNKKMPKIQTAADRFDKNVTLVWYLNEDKAAVCANIEKNTWDNCYEIVFKRKVVGGFRLKREAVAHAKKMLKWYFEGK
jgi:hypothetical protein